jgi:hypothetical protein
VTHEKNNENNSILANYSANALHLGCFWDDAFSPDLNGTLFRLNKSEYV